MIGGEKRRTSGGSEMKLIDEQNILALMIFLTGLAGSLLFFYRILNGIGLIFQKDGRKKRRKDQRRE